MSYRYLWKITVQPSRQAEFRENWHNGSVVLQEYPGARGTRLTKVLNEPETFLAIAEWESKAARDAMTEDVRQGTSQRAKRYLVYPDDNIFGEPITVARVEEIAAVLPKQSTAHSEEPQMPYRYLWKMTVDPSQQDKFIENWRKQSEILQEYPGARGTRLTKVLDEPNTFLAIAEWESKAARDAMDKDTDEGTSERAKRYHASTVNEDDVFGTSVTVARVEDIDMVMPSGKN